MRKIGKIEKRKMNRESKEEYENDPMIVVDEKRRSKAISLRPSSGFCTLIFESRISPSLTSLENTV